MCTQYWKRRLHFIFSECDMGILLARWVCLSSQINNQLSSPTFPYIFQVRSTNIIFSESKAKQNSLHKNIQIAAALATLLRLQFELFFHTSSCRVQKNPPEWRCFRGMDSSSSDSPCSCKWMSKNLIGSLSCDQRNKNPSDISASEAGLVSFYT